MPNIENEEKNPNPLIPKGTKGKGNVKGTSTGKGKANDIPLEDPVPPKEDEDEDSGEKAPGQNVAGLSAGKPRELIETVVLPNSRKASPTASNTSAALFTDQKRMKGVLEKQEKWPIVIPLEPGEKKGPNCFREVWINGFYMKIPKGIMVRVPENVFNILTNSLQLTNEAGQDMLISRSEAVEDALS